MRRALWFCGMLACWLAQWRAVTASEEEIIRWREVSLLADVPEYGLVRVAAERDGDHLVYVRVELATGEHLEVPPVGLADIERPQLEQIQVRYEVGYDPTPWLYVVIRYGDPIAVGSEMRWPEVSYAVQGNRFVRRGMRSWTPDGNVEWTSTELP